MPVAAQIERKYVGAGVETARLGGVEGVGPTLNPSPPRKRGVVQQQVHTPSLPRGPVGGGCVVGITTHWKGLPFLSLW